MSIDLVVDEQSALSAAWQLQRTGNFVAALDLAQEGLQRWPGSQALQYLGILALASCGSTQAALDALRASGLSANADEDCQALEARLLKDLAFGRFTRGPDRLAAAAIAYERVAELTGGTYSRENAALLWMLAGDGERALALAMAVTRQLIGTPVPSDDEGAYFYWATLAEAALIRDSRVDFELARAAADPRSRRNAWARSRTLRQMQRLAELRPQCARLIERWYRPPVGLVLTDEARESWGEPERIDLDDLPALSFCFGGRAAASWQELAALGVQLHAIYPSTPAESPLLPASAIHPERNAFGHSDTHTWSSILLDEVDDERSCAQTALGLSLGQADELNAPWVVLSRSADGWRVHRRVDRAAVCAALASEALRPSRNTHAFLFADAVSYSSLNAEETRRYWNVLLPRTAAAVLRQHAKEVLLRKTWGDSVHAVFTSASAAASAALEIQRATASSSEELGRGRRLVFRMALHYGSADEGIDPVEEVRSFFGPQLSFAARIEAVAPPGGIFVTEAFAARLTLEGARDVHCAYVGTTRLPKSYGRVRLLHLA